MGNVSHSLTAGAIAIVAVLIGFKVFDKPSEYEREIANRPSVDRARERADFEAYRKRMKEYVPAEVAPATTAVAAKPATSANAPEPVPAPTSTPASDAARPSPPAAPTPAPVVARAEPVTPSPAISADRTAAPPRAPNQIPSAPTSAREGMPAPTLASAAAAPSAPVENVPLPASAPAGEASLPASNGKAAESKTAPVDEMKSIVQSTKTVKDGDQAYTVETTIEHRTPSLRERMEKKSFTVRNVVDPN